MFKRALYLFFGILLAISSGSVSIYPIYSYYIKNLYNYSLRQINLFGSFINIGCWVAFGMGLIYDYLGPKISNCIGFIFLPCSFFVLYRLIESTYVSISLFWFLLLAFIMGQGSALLYTNALATSIKNFSKKNSSNVVGLIISNCAISPSIFASFKEAFDTMSIPSFITFVSFYISIIIILSFFLFDVYKDNKNYSFKEKVFAENKKVFIIGLFLTVYSFAIIIFIITLIINHIFNILLPAFMIFPLVHIILLIFVFMEKCGKFDDYLEDKYQQSHGSFLGNNYNNAFTNINQIPININKENDEGKNDNNIGKNEDKKERIDKNNSNDKNYNENEKDESNEKIHTDRENIGKIKNKLDFDIEEKEKINKRDNSQDVKVSRNLFNDIGIDVYNNDENVQNQENENINNIGEHNKNEEGRFSNDNNIERFSNINNNNEENINKNEKNEDEEKEMENIDINGEKKNTNTNKEKKTINNSENYVDSSNLSDDINESESKKEKRESISRNKDNEKKEKSNMDEKDNKNENNNKNEENKEDNKEEKYNNNNNEEENNKRMSYPKFSINSNNNDNYNGNEDNNNNINNNYPKFSLNSNNNDNYNGNEDNNNINNNYPKFSINSNNNDNEENNDLSKNNYPKFSITKDNHNEDNNNNINNINDNKDDINNSKLNNEDKNENEKNKKNIKQNNLKTNIIDSEKKILNQNEINNTTQNNLIINSTSPFDYNYNYHLDENENDEEESHNKCVLLLSLFCKPQIIKFFIVLVLTMGSMISNVNNIKFIVASISSNHSLSSTSLDKYPLIYFSFNSIARLLTGASISNLMGTPYTFVALQTITIIGFWSQLLGVFMTKFMIYISIALAGATHGSLMTFLPLYCRYYYNVNDLGTVLGFLTTGNAIGSILIATLIFPHYYHRYSEYNNYIGEYCSGERCFRRSYIINCIFMIVAIILSYWIFHDDKKRKIKEREEKEKMYRTVALCSNNPRVSLGSDNSDQRIN